MIVYVHNVILILKQQSNSFSFWTTNETGKDFDYDNDDNKNILLKQ